MKKPADNPAEPFKKALAEDKQAYNALQYSIRGQLNSGEGWCETGYDVEYAPRICVAT